MAERIDLDDLARVLGGARCPKYASSPAERARRQAMSTADRRKADRAWKQTVAHLSADQLARVRREAAGYTAPCEVTPGAPLAPLESVDDLRSQLKRVLH